MNERYKINSPDFTLDKIIDGRVLLDSSILLSTVLTSLNESAYSASEECFRLLERCKNSEVQGFLTPYALTSLWKVLGGIAEIYQRHDQKLKALVEKGLASPQKPSEKRKPIEEELLSIPSNPEPVADMDIGRRILGLVRSPFYILKIIPADIENAVELWQTKRVAVEAAVAYAAFRRMGEPPYIIVTAKPDYDGLTGDPEVRILKPKEYTPTVVPKQSTSPEAAMDALRSETYKPPEAGSD